jgi:hypothetical protein
MLQFVIRRRSVQWQQQQKNSHMQVVLTSTLCVLDSLLQNLLGLFDKLTVQINRVRVDSANHVVLTENVLGGLSVVVVGLLSMTLCFLGQVVGGTAIAASVGLLRLCGTVLTLAVFLAREVSQSVVLGLCIAGLLVVEGAASNTR